MTTPTGTLISHYEKSGKRARLFLPIWVIVFVIGLACVFALTSRPAQAAGIISTDESGLRDGLGLGAILAAGLGGLGLWWAGYVAFIRGTETFDVYDDGFTFRSGDGAASYLWGETMSYTHAVTRHYSYGIHTGDTRRLILGMADGQRYVIDNGFRGGKGLEETLPKMTFNGIYQRAAAAVNAGQNVQFGKITLTPSGLYNGKEALPFDDVADLKVARGWITIWSRNPDGGKPRKYVTLPFATTPNAYVFLEAVTRLSPALRNR